MLTEIFVAFFMLDLYSIKTGSRAQIQSMITALADTT
jgi:hypothetical protein